MDLTEITAPEAMQIAAERIKTLTLAIRAGDFAAMPAEERDEMLEALDALVLRMCSLFTETTEELTGLAKAMNAWSKRSARVRSSHRKAPG